MPSLRDFSDKTLLFTFGVLALTMVAFYQSTTSAQRAEITRDVGSSLAMEEQRKLAMLGDQMDDLRRNLAFLSQIPPVNGMGRALANGGVDPRGHTPRDVWQQRLEEIFVGFFPQQRRCFQAPVD